MKGFIGSVIFLATTAVFAADAVIITTPDTAVAPDPCINLPTPATIQACERGRQAPVVVAPVAAEPTATVIQTTQPSTISTMPAWQQALVPPVTTTTTSVQTTAPGTTPVVPVITTPVPATVVTTPQTTVTTTEVQTTAPTNAAPVILEQTIRPPASIQRGTTVIEKAY